MKRLFLSLGVGALVLFSPTANASPQADVDSYLAALHSVDIQGSRNDLLAIGTWVCQQINQNHFSHEQVAKGILANPTNTITLEQAYDMVDDALKYLCLGTEPSPPVRIV